MTTDKRPTSFRLSDQAHANLAKLEALTGTTKTALVEVAIALLVKQLDSKGTNVNKTLT